ncbi:hypothetical protein DENIS_2256 [Desulfonema ishimotonii]|uniref:histidine kinase n=1 Tax=Desulfonema ishimotonii TaxID=45657 RepID=A0A401FWG1_9BACT|nr:ATP-binding protein [Desulfonema ishimotonii]GBC61296.1 hypothetical protein DENIS_2256 [Desulfonema ishimotonii]
MHHPVFPHIRKLGSKFLFIVLPPVILSTLLITLFTGLFMYRDLKKGLESDIANLLQIQTTVLASDLWNYNMKDLEQNLRTLSLYPGISQIAVRNDNGQLLAKASSHFYRTTGRSDGIMTRRLVFIAPHQQQAIGTLTLSYHYGVIYKRLADQLFRDSLSLLMLVFVIVASAAAANRLTIGIPLERFLNAVRYADKKNIREPVDWPSEDELGQVITAYNTLLANLTAGEKELRDARGKAESANRAKSTFLANMSHELRTPLNAILGIPQLMIRNPKIPREEQENLAVITRSGEHLLTLINQVLDLSKIEAGKMALEENDFDLYALADSISDLFRLHARTKGLDLIFKCGPDVPRYVCTDETKLRQILINLLNNAVKFTNEGQVTLRISTEQEDAAAMYNLIFEFEDTGPGISPDEARKLFHPFVQTRIGQVSQLGTGLGLALSRRFARLMGGDIAVRSNIGRGSVFTVRITARPAEQCRTRPDRQAERRIVSLEPGQPACRVLVADETPDYRCLLVKMLSPVGFELREVPDCGRTLDIWREWRPHLIWMNIRMPATAAFDTIRQIRSSDTGKETAIIIITSGASEEEKKTISASGCDDFLEKPFREADIFRLIQTHIGVRYVYEDDTGDSGRRADDRPPPLTPEIFACVPRSLLENLKQAAICSDIALVESLADQIQTHSPPLYEIIIRLAHEFDYGKIMTILRSAIQQEDRPG